MNPDSPQQPSAPRVIQGGRYRHYKGGLYVTVCWATEEATLRQVVVYQHAEGTFWTRPADDFFAVIEVGGVLVPRFEYLGEG